MVKRYRSGILSGTSPTVSGVSASGFFNVTEVAQYTQSSSWPVALVANELYTPPGRTKLLGLQFNSSGLTLTGTYTVTTTGSLTYQTAGGVQNSGYATGWTLGSVYLKVDQLTTNATMTNKTYIAWYKGTQTNGGGNYSPSVPIFGEIGGSVYYGLGISNGKITVANGSQNTGTTSVNTGTAWFCLAWVVKSGYTVDGYVNGVKELTDIAINNTYPGTSYIGSGYSYAGCVAPTNLDAIQIIDGQCTASEIQNIYNSGIL